jgi:hypothetical protein
MTGGKSSFLKVEVDGLGREAGDLPGIVPSCPEEELCTGWLVAACCIIINNLLLGCSGG